MLSSFYSLCSTSCLPVGVVVGFFNGLNSRDKVNFVREMRESDILASTPHHRAPLSTFNRRHTPSPW
jgi:hypothetical protein